MTIEELMTKAVVTIRPGDTLDVAAHALWDEDCGILLVVDREGCLVGVITDRDICMSAWSRGRLLSAILVEEAMSKHVFTLRPDQDLRYAVEMMAAKQIRRIPIVDDADRPIGIVTMNDLAREAAKAGGKIDDSTRVIHALAEICRTHGSQHRAA